MSIFHPAPLFVEYSLHCLLAFFTPLQTTIYHLSLLSILTHYSNPKNQAHTKTNTRRKTKTRTKIEQMLQTRRPLEDTLKTNTNDLLVVDTFPGSMIILLWCVDRTVRLVHCCKWFQPSSTEQSQ